LRNSRFLKIEKLFIGFGIGIILLPLIPFLLYMLAGIKFSYEIALLSAALLYALSIGLLIRQKTHEDIKLPQIKISRELIIAFILIVLLFVTYWIRLASYSPVFFELDPYYYTDIAQQLLVYGENPVDDQTAWYPDLVVSHRANPALSYLEATWFAFYSGGTQNDNMLLAAIASTYPPLAATLAVFFLYLFVTIAYRREWGILAAGIASFVPIFLFKSAAGVMEVQPYAFFSLAFFFATYALMVKEKKIEFALLAGLAYSAVSLGSGSEAVALSVMLAFLGMQAVFLYLKQSELEELKSLLTNNGIIFAIGPLLASGILKGFFTGGSFSYFYPLILFCMLAFVAVLYLLRQRVADINVQRGAFGALIIIGIILFFLTPVGSLVKGFLGSTVGIAQYNEPLDRTIAEQHPAGSDVSGSIGFISAPFPQPVSTIMGIITYSVNVIIDITVRILNAVVETNLEYTYKTNDLLLLFVALFGFALIYSLYRSVRREPTFVFLFAAVILPSLLIGLIKAKYTIYSGFLLAGGIGFVFGELEVLIKRLAKRTSKDENTAEQLGRWGYYGLAIFAALLIFLQFTASSGGFAPAVLSQSYKTRFQDDPAALQAKFQSMCSEFSSKGISESYICSAYSSMGICSTSYDTSICTVAADPVAYANKGTLEQYNTKLCYYSLISDMTKPTNEELIAANFRCKKLDDYWIETMEWMQNSTPEGSRFTSWWDYGHWTNYFGQRNTVLRNEHLSKFMIGEVAYAYLDGTPQELASFMRSRNSTYAIFDAELTGFLPYFGGKYGALNYLMCARNNQTTVASSTGRSECEADHLWETIIIPSDSSGRACTISKAGNKSGVLAYKAYWTYDTAEPFRYTYMYPAGLGCYGDNLNNPNVLAFCQSYVKVEPAYCVGKVLLADGSTTVGTYLLNETYSNGDLKLNKAELAVLSTYPQTLHLGDVATANLIYSKRKIFLEDGNITDGYDDNADQFYNSNIYRALYLDELPGFVKVFTSKDKVVKVYKLVD
jgi:hypothetical protein